MKLQQLLFLIFMMPIFTGSCVNGQQDLAILPTPEKVTATGEQSAITSINFVKTNDLVKHGAWLQSWGETRYSINQGNNAYTHYDESLSDGAYKLKISKDRLDLTYHGDEGLTNALSTLQQLWLMNDQVLPIISIADSRSFSYRGMHLDVARHMFDVADIKKYIDYLAFYKFNYFHWHLTEDQGWRIEVKKYPKLQEIAAYRKETLIGHYNDIPQQFDGKRYGGFYTQEDVKEIVSHAMQRGIEVIPEIDIPGHSQALLAAYPELGCEDKKYEAATRWGVFTDVLCPNEVTFSFLEDVFAELATLFPSQYVHIGGDECPKEAWKKSDFCQKLIADNHLEDEHGLQSYFIQRMEKYLNSIGKKIIGWDEILEGGLAPNATVMSWRGNKGGVEAASKNHDVIMTPTSHCYFDYYQSMDADEPLAIGGFLPISKVYNWSVVPEELPAEQHKYVLGGQANVWTEYMPTFTQVEYMAIARMATLSEVLWGRKSQTLDQFGKGLLDHITYWEERGVNVANHLIDPSLKVAKADDGQLEIKVDNLLKGTVNEVLLPGKTDYEEMNIPYYLSQSGTYKVRSSYGGKTGRSAKVTYTSHLGNKAKIELATQPANVYSGSGNSCVLNGVEGNDNKHGGTEWLGFAGSDFDAEISFDEAQEITEVIVKTYKGEGQWIYLPKKIMIYALSEEGDMTLLSATNEIAAEGKVARVKMEFPALRTTRLRVVLENYGEIAEGRQGAGHRSWLFVDELIIK